MAEFAALLDATPELLAELPDAVAERVEESRARLERLEGLVHTNTDRPHLGYRNMGRRPIETVSSFVRQEA